MESNFANHVEHGYRLPNGDWVVPKNYDEMKAWIDQDLTNPIVPFSWQRGVMSDPLGYSMKPWGENSARFKRNWATPPAAKLANNEDDSAVRSQIAERVKSQQNARRTSPFATGATPMMNHGASGAYHAAIGAAQQGNVLGNMIAQTMDAHQDENDSRVAQLREMRRMEHEKELKRMELDALLARLQAAQR